MNRQDTDGHVLRFTPDTHVNPFQTPGRAAPHREKDAHTGARLPPALLFENAEMPNSRHPAMYVLRVYVSLGLRGHHLLPEDYETGAHERNVTPIVVAGADNEGTAFFFVEQAPPE